METKKEIIEELKKAKLRVLNLEKENRNEITITASYGAAPDDLAEAITLIKNKQITLQ